MKKNRRDTDNKSVTYRCALSFDFFAIEFIFLSNMETFIFIYCVFVCINIVICQESNDLSTLVKEVRSIEAGDVEALDRTYSTIAETIYRCQTDPIPSDLSILITERRVHYEGLQRKCEEAKFLSSYFASYNFPLFSAAVKADPNTFPYTFDFVSANIIKDRMLKVDVVSSSYLSIFEDYLLKMR